MQVETNSVAPTIVTEIRKASPSEQAAAERMIDEALEDGTMTAEEFEALALEAIQCAQRAGFAASLDHFNAELRSFSSSVRSVDQTGDALPDEDPAYAALSACEETYFYPAWDEFDRTNPRTEQEVQELEKQRERAVLDCASAAGYDFETLDDYVAGLEDVPAEVALSCTNAYNE